MLHTYQKKDFTACVNIFHDAFTAPPLSYTFITHEKTRRYLRDLTNTPGFMGFVYILDNEIVAFCFGKADDYFYPLSFKIDELAVLPTLHGKKMGATFMHAIEKYLQERGYSEATLQTARSIPAYTFYRKIGYTEVKETVNLTKPLY